MRPTTLALSALLLFPTVLALPPASLMPPLPSNEALPLNAVANGDFEDGLAGWVNAGYPSHARPIVSPGAAGTAKAFLSVNENLHGGIYQVITPPQVSGANLLLDFQAKIVNNAGRSGISKIEVYTHWNMQTGAAELTGTVGFIGPNVYFLVWDGPFVRVAAPTDGAFHHYQLLLPGVGKEVEATVPGGVGIGVLLIDGVPQSLSSDAVPVPAIATGTPASVDPATFLYIGEGNWCDCAGGPAPDVVYDEVYFGVKV